MNNSPGGLRQKTLISFESSRAREFARRLSDTQATVVAAPALQKVHALNEETARRFFEALTSGRMNLLILMTAMGTEDLMEHLLQEGGEKALAALDRITLVARGPKPAAVLQKYGLRATLVIASPNTWHELVQTLDEHSRSIHLHDAVVGIQESGMGNQPLIAALKSRGAKVLPVSVYQWTIPEDPRALEDALNRVSRHEADAVIFTNAAQVEQVLRFAASAGKRDEVIEGMRRLCIASIGPSTTEALVQHGIPVDVQAEQYTLDSLVADLKDHFRQVAQPVVSKVRPTDKIEPAAVDRSQSVFMKALRREPVEYTPVWLMRQAGRYMKEYRDVRNKVSFHGLCSDPDLVAEVTVTAVEKIGADAAILFSDILLIVESLGFGLEYREGTGPIISGSLKDGRAVDALPEIEPQETLAYVYEGVRATRRALRSELPLIGFAGAPFTLASYILEGGTSRSFTKTKAFMYQDPAAWHALMEKVTRGIIKHLNGQIEAGVDAVQLFDSWIGALDPQTYRENVLPHSRAVFAGLNKGVPAIHFGTGTTAFLEDFDSAGADALGVDFRLPLDEAWERIGWQKSIQGNLDPAWLFADQEKLLAEARRIMDSVIGHPGHIFNLGHGVLPQTPVDNVQALIEEVHAYSRSKIS